MDTVRDHVLIREAVRWTADKSLARKAGPATARGPSTDDIKEAGGPVNGGHW